MGFVLLGVAILYLFFALTVFFFIRKKAKSKKTVWFTGLLLVLFPFTHQLFFSALFGLFGLAPLQRIYETVDSPISVYWQDDVWPGFDEYGRKWMIENYLDGIHLKTLALNDGVGKIYIYHAAELSRAESRKIENNREVKELEKEKATLKKHLRDIYDRTGIKDLGVRAKLDKTERRISELRVNYERVVKEENQRIIDSATVVNSISKLPPMQYHILFKPIHNWFPVDRLYHGDQITITDTSANKIIAFSKRYMAFSPWISKISGEQPKFGARKGDIRVYEFDDKVLFGYADVDRGYDIERKRKLTLKL